LLIFSFEPYFFLCLQSPPRLLCRWPSDFSLARFRPQQRTEVAASICR
jgi:hypothetical protein